MIHPSPHASSNYYMGGFCHTSCCVLVSLGRVVKGNGE